MTTLIEARAATARAELGDQLRRRGPALAVSLGVAVALLGVSAFAAGRAGVPVPALLRDPAAIAGHPFYYGAFSNLGVLIFAGCAGLLLLGAAVLRSRRGPSQQAACLAFFGIVTALLALDDLFMLHEDVYRLLLPGPEQVPLAMHGALLAGGLFVFRDWLRRTDWLVLAVALGLLGASSLVDLAVATSPLQYLVEDGLKLLGMVAWVQYFAVLTHDALVSDA